MNKKFLIVCITLISLPLFSQNFQGKVYYKTVREFKIKLDSNSKVPEAQQKALQEMLQKQMQKTYVLTFNKNSSLYKEDAQLNEPVKSNGISITIGNSNDVLYKNIKTKTYVKSEENFGKRFLIQDSLQKLDWKLEKETKKIGKYLCLKATAVKMVDDYEGVKKKEKQKELKITAWYTPEIPVSNGPEYYFGLPGLILELHEDKMHYVANKIVLNPKNKKEIEAPKKGKKVTQKQYDAIMDKKTQEMIENFKSNRKKGSDAMQIIISN